jgi:hypothetical protein
MRSPGNIAERGGSILARCGEIVGSLRTRSETSFARVQSFDNLNKHRSERLSQDPLLKPAHISTPLVLTAHEQLQRPAVFLRAVDVSAAACR